jgi:hypothetical protein
MTIYPRTTSTGVKKGVWDPDAEAHLPSVTLPRFPSTVEAATGSDGHADIYDPVTGLIHSFWIMKFNTATNRWEAEQWSATPITGTGWGTPAKYMAGARAAGVPTSGGLIRKHEVNDGKEMYDHVLAMSMTFSGLMTNPSFVYPATSHDFDHYKNYGKFPEGSLVMLPPNFDVNTLARPFVRKIAKTLMKYGARVVDRNTGTPFYIYVENGSQWPAHKDANGKYMWDTTYINDLHKIRLALRRVTSASGWVDKDGNSVPYHEDGRGLNLLSLRGPWILSSGSTLGVYDSASETLKFGPTTTQTVQIQKAGTGYNKVPYAKIVAGGKYKVSVVATNGATINILMKDWNGQLLYQTTALGNGQSAAMTVPTNFGYIELKAASGVNVSSSSVKIKFERQ